MGRIVIRPDDADEDADWIKTRRWDLPTDLAGFLHVTGISTRGDVESFLALPAAVAMPPVLRVELQAWADRAAS